MSEKAWDDWNPKEDMIITVELESFKDSINITKEYNNEVKTAEISITTDKEYYYKNDQIILKVEGFSNNGEAVPEEVLAKTVWEVQGGEEFLFENNIGQKVICEYVIS